MKLTYITFTPSCQLTFTREEVTILMKESERHYDGHCRKVGQVGGFLYGLNNRFIDLPDQGVEEHAEVEFSFLEIDTLCKILEAVGYGFHASEEAKRYRLVGYELLAQMGDCLRKLNQVRGLMQEVR